MLTAAHKAVPLLSDDQTGRMVEFLTGRLHDDGGFRGRGPDSDLYYTVFGLESLMALGAPVPVEAAGAYLRRFMPDPARGRTIPSSLDLVHLACLGRALADLADRGGPALDPAVSRAIFQALGTYRSGDGGFGLAPGTQEGSAYGCLLAVGLSQDLGCALPDPGRVEACIRSLQMPDRGFANATFMRVGAIPATAAAITVLHDLGRPVPRDAVEFLVSQANPSGGFAAFPSDGAPDRRWIAPDLLSTATALHALSVTGQALDGMRQPCLDFVKGLWSDGGGFRGTGADPVLDCEYAYYGLLSLGSLNPRP